MLCDGNLPISATVRGRPMLLSASMGVPLVDTHMFFNCMNEDYDLLCILLCEPPFTYRNVVGMFLNHSSCVSTVN